MLVLKPICEHCGLALPNESLEAMICSFECTFCKNCVDNILANVCPNCGGGFEKRPHRPALKLNKYPAKKEGFLNPVVFKVFQKLKDFNRDIEPFKR